MTRWVRLSLWCAFWWGLFGFLAKLGSASTPPMAMQVLFTLGMFPLPIAAFLKNRRRVDTDGRGALYGVLNGVFAGLGGIAYFAAMSAERAALVGPVTSLYPLLTVTLAVVLLKEKLNRLQSAGIAIALLSIVLLSLPD